MATLYTVTKSNTVLVWNIGPVTFLAVNSSRKRPNIAKKVVKRLIVCSENKSGLEAMAAYLAELEKDKFIDIVGKLITAHEKSGAKTLRSLTFSGRNVQAYLLNSEEYHKVKGELATRLSTAEPIAEPGLIEIG